MPSNSEAQPRLLALSDLHVGHPENRGIVEGLRPGSAGDWLILAGDVGELFADIEWALGLLSERFTKVVWVPGNHELWTHSLEKVPWRGVERYERLVDMCRRLGVVTPEDPYPASSACVRTTLENGRGPYGNRHSPRPTGAESVLIPRPHAGR